jgi:hypothetical protein
MLAPQVGLGDLEGAPDQGAGAPGPWRRSFSLLGFSFLLVLAAAGVVAFEAFLQFDATPVNRGSAARKLMSAVWQTAPTSSPSDVSDMSAGLGQGTVWTFRENGDAWTGKLAENQRRYDRDSRHGFKTWKWSMSGWQLKLQERETTALFSVTEDEQGKLSLAPAGGGGPGLVLESCPPLESFPDLRVVFYAGIVAPFFVTMLLTWLMARLWAHSGWLRFTLTWPLMALVGLCIGGLAGFLLDVLDGFSHEPVPYWMQLSFAQGGLGIVVGFGLGILSWMRT